MIMLGLRCCIILLAALGHEICHGQQWTVFDLDNSPLPSTTIRSIASDATGGLWVGTDWGLCYRSSTGGWEVYQEGASPLAENDVTSVQVDGSGRVWIGTVSMGLQVKDGTEWTTYDATNSGLPESGIRDVFVDPSGTVWCCTTNGLAGFNGNDWVVYNSTPESHMGAVLATSNMRTVAVRADGTICLGTFNAGLHFIQGPTVEVLTVNGDGFFDNTAVDVLFHPQTGDRWVATPAAGLLRQQGPLLGGLWTQWNGSIGFPSNATTSLTVDPGGRVWTGTQIAGLIGVDQDGTYEQYTVANSGLPDNDVRAVHAAPDGSIWVGTFLGGLARFEPTVDVPDRAQHRLDWSVWPNPATDQFIIDGIGLGQGAEWQLTALSGATVRGGRSTGGRFTISVLDLEPGAYILQVMQGGLVGRRSVFVVQ